MQIFKSTLIFLMGFTVFASTSMATTISYQDNFPPGSTINISIGKKMVRNNTLYNGLRYRYANIVNPSWQEHDPWAAYRGEVGEYFDLQTTTDDWVLASNGYWIEIFSDQPWVFDGTMAEMGHNRNQWPYDQALRIEGKLAGVSQYTIDTELVDNDAYHIDGSGDIIDSLLLRMDLFDSNGNMVGGSATNFGMDDFSFHFANNTRAAMFSPAGFQGLRSPLNPVPEPTTALLFLTGLGMTWLNKKNTKVSSK